MDCRHLGFRATHDAQQLAQDVSFVQVCNDYISSTNAALSVCSSRRIFDDRGAVPVSALGHETYLRSFQSIPSLCCYPNGGVGTPRVLLKSAVLDTQSVNDVIGFLRGRLASVRRDCGGRQV
jgi:hypothetical protein